MRRGDERATLDDLQDLRDEVKDLQRALHDAHSVIEVLMRGPGAPVPENGIGAESAMREFNRSIKKVRYVP